MSATGGVAGAGTGGQEEDKKPMDQGAHINLKVKGQVFFFLISMPGSYSIVLESVSAFLIPVFVVVNFGYFKCSEEMLALQIIVWDGNEVFFRIKRSTQLRKLMSAYCDRQSVELNSIAFLFDGRRLRGEQTPDEVECGMMEAKSMDW
ncbi:Small ubiquitin-related modifier 1 [Vitis vinifera]|uniref:Small ubiquitin-related modifier 1 n=1 Tax=Vitis vinifera TaxID=29760 RepID=A0A438G3J7_VITVI|nr:Small ubiquitin-related modifier 1 [Vitis vinifera]